MNIRLPIRILAAASALTLIGAGLATTQANALPKHPGDNGVRCAYFNQSTGEWEFYLVGDYVQIKTSDGQYHTLLCGYDGNWISIDRFSTPQSPLPVPLRPVAGLAP
jgi:hypothetical protein